VSDAVRVPPRVSIAYCANCGYEPQTLELAGVLMKTFGHDISEIQILPWIDGSFDVTVGDVLVHSMYRDGGFPDPQTVVQAVREQLAAH
jgi:selenoprotein W-related protein